MDFEAISRELLRARRGARTQKSLSKALGFKSNVVFAWESGRDALFADVFFRVVLISGQEGGLIPFLKGHSLEELKGEEACAHYLRALLTGRTQAEVASQLGASRYRLGRWMGGQTRIPLWVLLHVIQLTTLSLFEFLECLVDPTELPSVAESYREMRVVRQASSENPWSHAILQLLGTRNFQEKCRHEEGTFASRLGMSVSEERVSLKLLIDSGQIEKCGGRYRRIRNLNIDTRAYPEQTRQLASFWMRLGAEKVLTRGNGKFAFNTFSISEAGHQRLRDLQSTYFREMRSIVAEDAENGGESGDVALVAAWQLYRL